MDFDFSKGDEFKMSEVEKMEAPGNWEIGYTQVRNQGALKGTEL